MTAVLAHNASDRKAETWAGQLAPFERLEFAVSDAAKGISAAVSRLARARRDTPSAPTLEHGLDLFHTTMEARRVLARHWRHAEAAWEKAEAAEAAVARAKRQGLDARGVSRTAHAAWRSAVASLEQFERLEAAWNRAHAALDRFTPEGRLNDRVRAESEIAATRPALAGSEWSKVRNFLDDPRSLRFLDRMHRRLEEAEPRADWRASLAWRWWLRHGRPKPADPLTASIRSVGRHGELAPREQRSYDQIAAVLKDTVRASSAVECLNSVLRMQQSRHRRMTQPMLDLKRLYWNSRVFRSGPRKTTSPYQALGLPLPSFDFWDLLQTNPAHLTQQLSTQGNAE